MADLAIVREIIIDAPAEVVWRTITEPERITQWFADRVELDLHPGERGVFEGKATSRATTAGILIETVDPPRVFSLRWGHPEGTTPVRGNSTLVEFTLTAETTERTRLRVVETGLEDIDWPDDDKARYTDDHRHGWEVHLGRLGDLLAPSK